MKLDIRLFANLRAKVNGGKKELQVDLPDGSRVGDLIEQLNLTDKESLIVMVNGRREFNDRVLKEGDRIGIFPPVGGG